MQPWDEEISERRESPIGTPALAVFEDEEPPLGRSVEWDDQAERVSTLHAQLTSVQRAATEVALEPDLPKLLQRVLELVRVNTGLENCEILGAEAGGSSLRVLASLGRPCDGSTAREWPVLARVLARSKAVLIENGPEHRAFFAAVAEDAPCTACLHPLVGRQGELIGLLVGYWNHGGPFPEEAFSQMGAFAALAAVAMDRIRLGKRLQQELGQRVESETLYRTLVEESGQGVYLAQHGQLTYANPALCRMVGYQIQELIHMPILRLICPEDQARMARGLRLSSHFPVLQDTFRVKPKTGGVIHVEVHASRVLLRGQAAVLGVVHDVSERVRAAEALRVSLDRSESLAASIHAISRAKDEDTLLAILLGSAGRLVDLPHWWFSVPGTGSAPALVPVRSSQEIKDALGPEDLSVLAVGPGAIQTALLQDCEQVFVLDLQGSPALKREIPGCDLRTLLCIPLVREGRVLGCLSGGSFGDEGVQEVGKEALEALQSLCLSAALGLNRQRAQNELRKAANRAGTLAQATRDLAEAHTEADFRARLFRWADALYPDHHWFYNGFDAGSNSTVTQQWTPDLERIVPREVISTPLPVADVPVYREAHFRQLPIAITVCEGHPMFPGSLLERVPYRSLFIFPMIHEGETAGLLCTGTFGDEGRMEVDEAVFKVLADLAGNAGISLGRLRAQLSLADSETRYRRSFDENLDAILVGDHAHFIMANDAAVQLLGRSRERLLEAEGEVQGFLSPALLPAEEGEAASIRERILDAFGGNPQRFEWHLVRPDGTSVQAAVSLSLVRFHDRPFLQGIFRDITAAKLAREEKETLERQLVQAQKMESLGVLAGGIAHDFNNLLMGVLGNAGLALDCIDPAHPARANILALQQTAHRAADLTRQLLAYSGRGQFLIAPLDLGNRVVEILQLLKVSLPKGTAIEVHAAPALPLVEADAAQVQQVVMNLVINAAEAIGGRLGFIRITLEAYTAAPDAPLCLVADQTLAPGEYVKLEVSDTGIGMDSATLERIFEPFFTTKFTGRGLGLSAILGIVRAHRGGLEVESTPGIGTTFRVYLPVSKTQSARPDAPPVKGDCPGADRLILVVDDEEIVRSIACQALERKGFRVVEAVDGLAALELLEARQGEIELVLLDMTMPRMGGAETLQAMRSRGLEAPVILSSGFSEGEATAGLLELGLAGFIQKPYTPRILAEKVGMVLAGGA